MCSLLLSSDKRCSRFRRRLLLVPKVVVNLCNNLLVEMVRCCLSAFSLQLLDYRRLWLVLV